MRIIKLKTFLWKVAGLTAFHPLADPTSPGQPLTPRWETSTPHFKDPYVFINHGDFGIFWHNIFMAVYYHTMAFLGIMCMIYQAFYGNLYIVWQILIMTTILEICAGLGLLAGAHRLWTHKSYEAKLPLRIFLMVCQTISGVDSIYMWALNHYTHHKFSDTDSDLHNIKRGTFFAQIGWPLRKPHPDYLRAINKFDFSFLLEDPVVKFQKNHLRTLFLWSSIIIPVSTAVFAFGQNFFVAYLFVVYTRLVWTIHRGGFVNSIAHIWGDRPFDSKISPTDNWLVSIPVGGEGYHNYHHAFPWDYRTSEEDALFNPTGLFITLMGKLGLAYNLKTVTPEIIKARKNKISHEHNNNNDIHEKFEYKSYPLLFEDEWKQSEKTIE